MEEAQEKLKILLQKAKKENFDVKRVKILRKYQKHFELNFKWKLMIATAIFWMLFMKFNHLIDTKKVIKKLFQFKIKFK
jgi:hypothetical protein